MKIYVSSASFYKGRGAFEAIGAGLELLCGDIAFKVSKWWFRFFQRAYSAYLLLLLTELFFLEKLNRISKTEKCCAGFWTACLSMQRAHVISARFQDLKNTQCPYGSPPNIVASFEFEDHR